MILCLTHSNDLYTIDIVMKRLKELGKEAYRMNSDLFSSKLSFDYSLSDNKNTVQIQIDDRVIDANAVEAVWYRKLWQAEAPDESQAESPAPILRRSIRRCQSSA